MGEKIYYVYIMTNRHNSTLYTGITNNIRRRVHEHRTGSGSRFAKKNNLTKLVYYECLFDVRAAIAREKQITGGSRKSKLRLIESFNPEWTDLADEL